jgi:aminoglycoside phosphotransferase (APT) family kinase protein
MDTRPPLSGMEIDVDRLAAFLARNIPDYRGPLIVHQFTGGQSNPTYLLITPERRYVLRKRPPGQLLASAHAVDREYRVMSALGQHTDVPVPQTCVLCTDESVVGTAFYVMEHVAGRIFRDPAFPELPREQRRDYAFAVCECLARLHRVNPAEIGLGDYGKSAGYVARQVARWSKQYREDTDAGRVEAIERLIEWLPANLPAAEEPPAIVHGDYRVDNVMFHPTEARVLAVLDWELSSLGEARADLAYHLMVYRLPPLALPGLAGADLDALGLPTEAEYLARYCECVGRKSVPDLEFYIAFCMFRLAGIFHGIRGRVARGNAVSPHAREYARYVEPIANLAWEQAQRAH